MRRSCLGRVFQAFSGYDKVDTRTPRGNHEDRLLDVTGRRDKVESLAGTILSIAEGLSFHKL